MIDGPFLAKWPAYGRLADTRRVALLDHYRECGEMWRHFTPTIRNAPSIAAALNVGAFSLAFDPHRQFSPFMMCLILGILFWLNFCVAYGLFRHIRYQRAYGDQRKTIELYMAIRPVAISGPSGASLYLWMMILLMAVNLALGIIIVVRGYW